MFIGEIQKKLKKAIEQQTVIYKALCELGRNENELSSIAGEVLATLDEFLECFDSGSHQRLIDYLTEEIRGKLFEKCKR